MKFDWSNYLLLADDLRTAHCKGGVEARLRSSISRAYYGHFHLIRLHLEKEGVKFGDLAQIHQEVVQALRTHPDKRKFALGAELGRLRKHRNVADYQDEIENLAQLEADSVKVRESIRRAFAAMER
jgi:hypothetical protein